ncbi:MAG: hypothetical protein GX277_02375 [Bacteroidales bacterium]|nr:hypothetical protein [Bacteroidales bacterium]
MSKERIYKELIIQMSKDGEITSSEYKILLEKGEELGFDKQTVDLLIKMELLDFSENNYSDNSETEKHDTYETHTFKSAITRGGAVLTPDIIVIDNDSVTYKKRNKYLINVDSLKKTAGIAEIIWSNRISIDFNRASIKKRNEPFNFADENGARYSQCF